MTARPGTTSRHRGRRLARTWTAAALGAQTRAELLKLRSVRATIAIGLATIALEVVFKVISVMLLTPAAAAPAEVVFALKPSITYPVLAATIGLLLASAEWRHRTAGPTYTVQPRRELVLAAKTVVAAAAGLVVGLVATGIAGGAALLVAERRGLPALPVGQLAEIALGSVAAASLLAVLGVAVGTLVRNQVGALAAATGGLFVLPPLTVLLDPGVYAWTPTGAADALAAQQPPNPDLLSQPAGAILLLAYAAAVSVGAATAVRRRDVD